MFLCFLKVIIFLFHLSKYLFYFRPTLKNSQNKQNDRQDKRNDTKNSKQNQSS